MGVLGEVGQALLDQRPDPRVTWRKQARPEQMLPPGTWRVCYWQGGRGSGKTAAGAGALAEWVQADTDGEGEYGIIAPTYADAWTKCVEGEAGILRALGTSMKEVKDHSSATVKSAWRTYGQVILHNGVIIYVDSASEGGLRIQGRNLKGAWADEIGLWDKWETAWKESLNFAVRKGMARILATGTPKASRKARKLIRGLIRNDPEYGGVVVRKLRTRDNIANLSQAFVRAVVGGFRGTRLEMQELEGELLDDVANALWTRDLLDAIRDTTEVPTLRQTYLGVDPSDGNEDSDEQAYTLAGLGMPEDGHIRIVENWGGQEAPAAFARRCIRKAVEWNATIVVEKNHGGAWLKEVFVQAQRDMGTSVRVKLIHASNAKRTRAEPVSLLYERYAKDGKPLVLHHHNIEVKPCDCHDNAHPDGHQVPDEHMPELEDQMATFTGAAGERSPDRLDSLVWAATPFLRASFGPQVGAKAAKYEVSDDEKDLPAIEDLVRQETRPTPGARRRLAGAHNGAYAASQQWGIDSFAPVSPDDEAARPPGDSGNVHPWR